MAAPKRDGRYCQLRWPYSARKETITINMSRPVVCVAGLSTVCRRLLMLGLGCAIFVQPLAKAQNAPVSVPVPQSAAGLVAADSLPRYAVRAYEIRGDPQLVTNAPAAVLFSRYTGTNIGLTELIGAAAELQLVYRKRGYPDVLVAIGPEQITNSIVIMNIARGNQAQVLVSGKRYAVATDEIVAPSKAVTADAGSTTTTTNAPAAATNTGPRFVVRAYEIRGNTLLTDDVLMTVFAKHTGTNIGVPEILKAGQELQMEYRTRGYPTVSVTIPPQQITNEIVKLQVFQGRLSSIKAVNNRYFSFENIMRSLPSLRSTSILSEPVFQAELDRANANPDRQIYPQLGPGVKTNTTELLLKVKDRLPLHGKVELNNYNSPGTPALRVNASAVYNNLWQLEHSIGAQYSFSPEEYKTGDEWSAYDKPKVANYSAFYRLPFGNYEAVQDLIKTKPTKFGYDEGTRKFNLPAPSGRPELNLYASRSTIDTGVLTLSERSVLNIPGVISINAKDEQQDLTINGDVGTRLSLPLRPTVDFQSSFSGGFDYKTYNETSYKTNNFAFSIITRDPSGDPNPPTVANVASPNPPPDGKTIKQLDYFPLALSYYANWRDPHGTTAFSLGGSGNVWYSGSLEGLRTVTTSSQSHGNWVILSPSLSHDFIIRTNWTVSLYAGGQWASEPVISTEQFAVGGVGTVRGYLEGEVSGSKGWRTSLELKTPPHVIGIAYGKTALTIRGSLYTDYAEVFRLGPLGREEPVSIWGCGFGGVIALGSHWDARFLCSWPLIATIETERGQPHFNFSLTGQF